MDTHVASVPRRVRRTTRPARTLAVALLTSTAALAATQAAPASASTTVTQSPASTTAAASYPAMAPDTYENRVQHWINVRRGQHGLRPLRTAACIDRVAERWGSYLAANDAFYHQSMEAVLDRCNAYYAGETLGRGANMSPRRLVTLWMRSPEHRPILLSKQPRRIGIGAFPDAYGRWVVAADFMRH